MTAKKLTENPAEKKAKYAFFRPIKRKGLFLFFQEIFSSPVSMGAAFPSSKKLAEAVANQIPANFSGTVVELGPGTGVITKGLLDYGIKPENLFIIEKSKPFVKYLKEHFSNVTVIEGDAQNTDKFLENYPPASVVICGLPLKALPKSVVKNILQSAEKVLMDGGLFVQFTYYHGKMTLPIPKNFQLISSKMVFLNFPPARVNVFKHKRS
jgi:phosphatidylethanolamine/phosphatidyl-N-methylethanolamine N-methyltransferase